MWSSSPQLHAQVCGTSTTGASPLRARPTTGPAARRVRGLLPACRGAWRLTLRGRPTRRARHPWAPADQRLPAHRALPATLGQRHQGAVRLNIPGAGRADRLAARRTSMSSRRTSCSTGHRARAPDPGVPALTPAPYPLPRRAWDGVHRRLPRRRRCRRLLRAETVALASPQVLCSRRDRQHGRTWATRSCPARRRLRPRRSPHPHRLPAGISALLVIPPLGDPVEPRA